jgi:hypothetical protein
VHRNLKNVSKYEILENLNCIYWTPVYSDIKSWSQHWFIIYFPGPPDSRFIRVETCMFMVKLPQYSSQELMTQRLLYAINCREDPLSGWGG